MLNQKYGVERKGHELPVFLEWTAIVEMTILARKYSLCGMGKEVLHMGSPPALSLLGYQLFHVRVVTHARHLWVFIHSSPLLLSPPLTSN